MEKLKAYLPVSALEKNLADKLKIAYVSLDLVPTEHPAEISRRYDPIYREADLIYPATYVTEKTLLARLKVAGFAVNYDMMRSLAFAREYHKGQIREDGTAYYEGHILPVIQLLFMLGSLTPNSFIIAALHDVPEDNENISIWQRLDRSEYPSIEGSFNKEVAEDVALFSKKVWFPDKHFKLNQVQKAFFYSGYIDNFLQRPDLLVIKLADFIVNCADDLGKEQAKVLAYFEKRWPHYQRLIEQAPQKFIDSLELVLRVLEFHAQPYPIRYAL